MARAMPSRILRASIAMLLALTMAGAERLAHPSAALAIECTAYAQPAHAYDDPSTPGDPAYQTLEDSGQITIPASNGWLANDRCADGITGMGSGDVDGGNFDFLSTGEIWFKPFANFNGAAHGQYHWSGTWGTSNDATVTIQVIPVNDEPQLAYGDNCLSSYEVAEDSGSFASVCKPWGLAFEGSNPPEASQVVTYHIRTDNPELFASGPAWVKSSSGTPFTFTPKANAYGSTHVYLWVTDDGGTANGGDDTSLPGDFYITITPVDDAPAAGDDSYTTPAGQQLVVSVASGVLGNDTDIDGPARTASKLAGPSHGVAALQPDGSFTYTPQAGYSGPDSFTYRATAGALHDDATVSITVLAPGATAPPPTPTPASTAPGPSGAAASPGPADSAGGPTLDPPTSASPPPTTGLLPSPLPSDPAGPAAPAGGSDSTPWLIVLLIVVIVVIGLNAGLYQYLRSRRSQSPPEA